MQQLQCASRAELRRRGAIVVTGSAGGWYRIDPGAGCAERIERHGRRWFARATYCLHPPDENWPDADVALAQMLLIVTDEPAFLMAANEHRREMLWNGQWLRRLAAARKERRKDAVARHLSKMEA